ncbi:bacterio-opsin activator domain-containing protein [Halomarina rubra]|uniref:Bacterio-opsin activator domain-containing protein n=1 Tax=Halomarina rubra TaxID=2071873 RepID=A0ABD6B0U5_9EURY|nr:bacterio-opsin activator domain-containing protein [Halomarina rubra]
MGDQNEPPLSFEEGATADVLSRVTDAVVAVDEGWRLTYLNEQAEAMLERFLEDHRGTVLWKAFPELVDTPFETQFRQAMTTQEAVTFEAYYGPQTSWFEVRAYPSSSGLSVYLRDVTERIERQRALRERENALQRAYEVVAGSDRPFEEQVDELLGIVREVVGTEYATLSRVEDDRYVFEAVDMAAEAVNEIETGDVIPLEATSCERVVSTGRTLAVGDMQTEAPDIAGRAGNVEWGLSCYLGAPVVVGGDVYGTFCFYGPETRPGSFSDWEVTFVELLSNWVGGELDRRRHLEQLTALDDLDGVVRDITAAVIEQPTREELEATVCACLAAADSYTSAWIGEVDQRTEEMSVRAAAGTDAPLDRIARDDTDATGTAFERAVREGSIQVDRRRDAPESPTWTEAPSEGTVQTWAAVPIAHEGTLYGVLNVYSERAEAFRDQERAVVEQLGALLGHAITATQRKAALMSDDVVELDLEIRDVFDVAVAEGEGAGVITFDRTVPVSGGDYLAYGRTSDAGVATLQALVEYDDAWTSLEVLSDDDDHRFVVTLSSPPVVSVVAAQGGSVESATVDGGTYRLTVHLPRGADVQSLVDSVRSAHPDATLVAQRQTDTHERQATESVPTAFEGLTARQRAAVESAYYAGFFEWPRDSTGEEVAGSLDISPSTFHQHLRTGERKILSALLDEE